MARQKWPEWVGNWKRIGKGYVPIRPMKIEGARVVEREDKRDERQNGHTQERDA